MIANALTAVPNQVTEESFSKSNDRLLFRRKQHNILHGRASISCSAQRAGGEMNFDSLAIVVAASFISILLLAIAIDMPVMLAAVLVAGVVAGCVEYYVRIERKKNEPLN
ncbi:MAG TPA: hypothetical protein VHE09_14025 [Rhizomicrobium sp.]|nr:hypothetical protein [Rhizomicrobium sp.]